MLNGAVVFLEKRNPAYSSGCDHGSGVELSILVAKKMILSWEGQDQEIKYFGQNRILCTQVVSPCLSGLVLNLFADLQQEFGSKEL